MHRLLKRQLKRHLGEDAQLPKEVEALLEAVNQAYEQADLDRTMVERSLELTSDELTHRNLQLQRDLQQRTIIEQALRSSQERMRLILDTSPLPVMLYDAQGAVEYINPAFERLFGWKLGDFAQLRAGFIPEDIYYQALAQLQQAQEGQGPAEFESQRAARDGRLLDVQINVANLRDPKDETAGMVAIVRDITEGKARQIGIERSQRQLSEAIAFFPEAILMIDEQGRVAAWNQAMEALTGISEEQMLGRGDYAYAVPFFGEARPMLIDYVHRPLEEVRERYPSVIQQGQSFLTDDAFLPNFRGGMYLWGKARALYDSDGNYLGAIEVVRDVTERRKSEQAMREQRAFLRQVIDANPDYIFAKDRQGRFSLVNQAMAEAYGATVEALIGKTDADFNNNPEEVESFQKTDLEVIETGRAVFIAEEQITDASGNLRWIQTAKRPLLNENGEVEQVLGVSTDITERKTTEQELTRRNLILETLNAIAKETSPTLEFGPLLNNVARMLCQLLDGTSAYVSQWDVTNRTVRVVAEYVSPQAAPAERVSDLGEIHNLTPDELNTQLSWLSDANAVRIAHVDDPDLPIDERDYLRRFGGKTRLMVPLVGPSGLPFGHVEIWESRRKRQFPPQDIELLQVVARQVTSALSNALLFGSLQENKELLGQIIDINPNMLFAKNRQGRYTLANYAFAAALGYTVEDVIGKTDAELGRLPSRLLEYEEQDRIVFETGNEVFNPEEVNLGRDGRPRWRQTVKRALRDADGKVTHVLGIVNDITDIKNAERTLRETEERYRVLIENSTDVITLLDVAGVMLSASPNLANVLGYTENELLGKPFWDLVHEEDRPNVIKAFEESVSNTQEPVLVDYRIRNKAGEWRNLESLGKISTAPNEPPRMFITSRDITSRKEEQLIQKAAYERRGRYVRFSNSVAKKIAAATDLATLYNLVVNQLCSDLDFNYVQFLRFNAAANALVLMAGSGEAGHRTMARGYHVQLNQGVIGRAGGQARSVLVENVATDPLWNPTPGVEGTVSELATPVMLGDELLGVLDVQAGQLNMLDADLQVLLEVLSGQVAIAIEGIRLRTEMEERLRELNALQRLSTGSGWQAYGEANSAQPVGYRFSQDSDGPQPYAGQSPDDVPASRQNLAVRGETIGSIGIAHDPDRPLSPDEQDLLNEVTAEVAEALERARLFEASQRSAAELAVLNEMGQAFTEALNEDSIIENAYLYAARLLDVEDFFIALHDPERDQISFPLVILQEQRLTESHEMWPNYQVRPTGTGLTGWIVQNRQSVLIENNAEEVLQRLGLPYIQVGGQTQTWMGVPMTIGDRVLGVIAAQSDTRPGLYNQHHLGLLTSVASQAAIAIDNARLFTVEQQRAEQERLVRTITDRVRRGADAQSILRVALEELSQVLEADQAVVRLGTRDQLLNLQPAARQAQPTLSARPSPAPAQPATNGQPPESSNGAQTNGRPKLEPGKEED
ncbi:MAG: PAS domain S-box protein [Anaerolineae bacterium]|nr:MAG: PAS domain S-box protein [Anaerolineae bacterium]